MNTIDTKNIKYWFDLKNIKKGFYSSQYFIKTKKILDNIEPQKSTMQFSILSEGEFVVAGIFECVSLIKKFLSKKILKKINLYTRNDGEIIKGPTSIFYIEGYYKDFCILENLIDGILNSRISIATRAYELKKTILNNQDIVYMADRTDDYFNQSGNGLAAYIGGIKYFSTFANLKYIKQIPNHNANVVGTMPHALIQQFHGDIVKTTKYSLKYFGDTNITILLDYNNDVIGELKKIKPYLSKIYAVRIDTSKSLVDKSLKKTIDNYGVNPQLISIVKKWLIDNNFEHIKIIVSSSIDDKKINLFNSNLYKPDIFGIGNYFLTKKINITGDLVMINDKPVSKVGRHCFLDYKKLLVKHSF